jgi:hypothetical protein
MHVQTTTVGNAKVYASTIRNSRSKVCTAGFAEVQTCVLYIYSKLPLTDADVRRVLPVEKIQLTNFRFIFVDYDASAAGHRDVTRPSAAFPVG